MYKVFFVDDEASMRYGIRNNINWDDSDFTLVGEAPDGEMALSIMQEILPDILITDVKMPFMDGIELSHKAKQLMPWLKIIILSGHDEFIYAKQAISIGVEEYLLKPVTSESLMKTLTAVKVQIEEEQNEHRKILEFERLVNDTKNLQIEKLLSDLTYGSIDFDAALKWAAEFELDILADYYILMIVEIKTKLSLNYDNYINARSWAIDVLKKWEDALFFTQGLDRIVCILKGSDKSLIEENAYACACAVKYEVERRTISSVSVAIGSLTKSPKTWFESISNADIVKKHLNLLTASQIMGIKDIRSIGILPHSEDYNLPIIDKLRYGSRNDISEIIDSYFNTNGDESVVSFLFMNYVFVDVLMAASKLIEEIGGEPKKILKEYSNINTLVETTSDFNDFKKVLYGILEKTLDFRNSNAKSKYTDIILKAKEYIQQNYAQQGISLHSVAKEVNISPNHFSTIFSLETGETFINYITKIRIERAKVLLKTTSMRTSEVGYEVGYSDTHYFSYVFKKNVGMNPKEFRK